MIVLIFSKYFINKDKDRRAAVKKFLIIMFSIVVLAGIGASIYVSTIDWNQHKDGIAKQLKENGANQIFLMATFALFTNGYEIFDEYYDKGIINRIYTFISYSAIIFCYLPTILIYFKPVFSNKVHV